MSHSTLHRLNNSGKNKLPRISCQASSNTLSSLDKKRIILRTRNLIKESHIVLLTMTEWEHSLNLLSNRKYRILVKLFNTKRHKCLSRHSNDSSIIISNIQAARLTLAHIVKIANAKLEARNGMALQQFGGDFWNPCNN